MARRPTRRKDSWRGKSSAELIPGALAAVLDARGRILLVRRADNLQWGLPGGMIEKTDSLADALRRELKEETGLRVSPLSIVGVYSNPRHVIEYADRSPRREFSIVCRCRLAERQAKLSTDKESIAIGWFSKHEALRLPLSPGQRVSLRDAFRSGARGLIR